MWWVLVAAAFAGEPASWVNDSGMVTGTVSLPTSPAATLALLRGAAPLPCAVEWVPTEEAADARKLRARLRLATSVAVAAEPHQQGGAVSLCFQ